MDGVLNAMRPWSQALVQFSIGALGLLPLFAADSAIDLMNRLSNPDRYDAFFVVGLLIIGGICLLVGGICMFGGAFLASKIGSRLLAFDFSIVPRLLDDENGPLQIEKYAGTNTLLQIGAGVAMSGGIGAMLGLISFEKATLNSALICIIFAILGFVSATIALAAQKDIALSILAKDDEASFKKNK